MVLFCLLLMLVRTQDPDVYVSFNLKFLNQCDVTVKKAPTTANDFMTTANFFMF